ncbi:MAG: type II secretion system protein [Verrucomicrobiota bacterium]|jgi:prepilin-type N-terminal cleavage/methylation domain-containing protein
MKPLENSRLSGTNSRRAFTLIELLVAIAVIGILGALMFPALARSKEKANRVACMNNQKQLALAWQMYADQSGGNLASNDWVFRSGSVVESPPGSWVTGNAALDTNPANITGGSIYPLVKSVQIYRCPVDHSVVLGTAVPALRSYSLSCYMGGPEEDIEYDVEPLTRAGQIQRPSTTLTFLEEDISTIDDGHFLYSTRITNWINVPAWRHENGDVLAFADGHLEYWKWRSALPTSTYVEGAVVTNPDAQEDITRLQKTAAAAN